MDWQAVKGMIPAFACWGVTSRMNCLLDQRLASQLLSKNSLALPRSHLDCYFCIHLLPSLHYRQPDIPPLGQRVPAQRVILKELIPILLRLLVQAQLGIYIAPVWFPLQCRLALARSGSLHFALDCLHLVLQCVAVKADKATRQTGY